MAAQADGTIYINTAIDSDGFKAGGKEIEAAARRAAHTVKGIGDAARIALERQTNAFIKSNQLYAQQEQKVKDLEKQLQELSSQKVGTEAFEYDAKLIEDSEKKLISLKKTQEEFLAAGGKESSSAYKRRQLQIEELRNTIQAAKADQEDLIASGEAYQPVDTSAIEQRLINERERLVQMNASLNVSYDALRSKVEQYGGSISGLTKRHNTLRKVLSSFASAAKKAGAAVLSLHKNTKKSNGSMGAGLKNILKYTLGISTLVALFNKIRNAIKEGMQNLAQYSGETNTNLSALKSSLTQLKNSLATAFNPILTVVTPILTQFINLISQAVTYVGMFFAALTGQKSFTKAVAVQEDYAASLGKTAKNAKEANKYLSGLDEIRTYSENKDSSAGSGGVDPSQMFEEVEIPSFIGDWIEKFKEAWENADFTEFGTLVGTKLKNALDNIPWEGIKENARKIGTSLATFINGFVETPGLFDSIGKTVGEGVNTAVAGAKAFLSTTKFEQVGRSIADSLNSAMKTIEWGEMAQTISLGIEGVLDTVNGFLDELDWEELADSIWEFLSNIDFKGILGRLGLLILEAFQGIFLFGNKLSQDIVESLADFFRDIGWDSVAGFFDGFAEKMEEYREKVKGWFQDVIDWVKEKLGIHSPSTVFAEIGRYVIEGFINGISEWIPNIKEVFGSIKETVLGKCEEIKSKTSEIWENIKSTASEKWDSMKSTAAEKFSGVKEAVSGAWENAKSKTSSVWSQVTSTVGSTWDSLKTSAAKKFDEITAKVSDSWDSAKKATSTIWSAVKDDVSTKFDDIKQSVSSSSTLVKNNVSAAWNDIKTASSSSWNNIKSNTSTIWNGLKSTASTVFNGIKTIVSSTWSSISATTSSIWSSIQSTISNIWNSISSIVSTMRNTFSGAIDSARSAASSIVSAFSSIHIPLPHFSIGSSSHSIGGVSFSVPSVSVNWYGTGGLFDQPSVIGVGEAGQEAVLPLQNSKVMSLLASSIVSKMPAPYLASGAVVPPKAQYSSVQVNDNGTKNADSIYDMLASVADKLSKNQGIGSSGTIRIPISINGRQILEAVVDAAKLQQTVSGNNPLML